MQANMGIFDRISRTAVGLALIGFAIGSFAPDTGWNWVGWIGVPLILFALVGVCPVYRWLGMSTR
jgi:Inner membrane protein YgaP-like, transmembrane domain